MALTDEGNGGIPATMLVGPAAFGNGSGMPYPVPMYGGGGNQGGFGNDGGWWIVLLIIVIAALGGNWGGNGNGGGFGGGQPIIVNDGGNGVQRGFDQAAVMSGISGIQSGIQSGVQNLSTQLCNCCADMNGTVTNGFFGVQQALSNGFSAAEAAANTRQIADMQTAFAGQTAVAQGFNGLASQLADCCCENRLATERLNYTIATENCADRYEAAQNTRDIIENANRNNQAILDKLCRLELDAKNDRIADLERQLTMANLTASQTAQTAAIRAGQVAEVDALYDRLSSCPVPTMPVYGSQPIFTCPNNNGCGCGGNF